LKVDLAFVKRIVYIEFYHQNKKVIFLHFLFYIENIGFTEYSENITAMGKNIRRYRVLQ